MDQSKENQAPQEERSLIVGYTAGVFDLFHIGHVNILRNARAMCDRLIVGVTSDELVSYKGKKAAVPFEDRVEVVRACRYVDLVVPQNSIDKFLAWEKLRFDRLFVGDDWFGHDSWKKYEERLKAVGAQVIYFPYTKGSSSTQLRLKTPITSTAEHLAQSTSDPAAEPPYPGQQPAG